MSEWGAVAVDPARGHCYALTTVAFPPPCLLMFRFNNERTIYMEGLPFEATEESITAFFAKVGPLAGLRLPRWHDSGRLRGYGHAEFATADEASRAMKELNGAYHTDVTACVTTS